MATQPLLVSPSVLSSICLNLPSRSIPRKQNYNSGFLNGSWEEESVARAFQIQISSKVYINYSIDNHIMPIKPRRSLSLLASVFQSSQSEYSNPSTAPSTAPSTPSSENRSFSSDSSVEITPISREPAYYDDLQSSNIDVLSVSSTSATVEETSLLDSDPFADLSAPPIASPLLPKERPSPSSTRPPKSPLSPTGSTSRSRSATLVSSPVRPAYQKRPIHSSPSLPSLSTLATANVNTPKKVCRLRRFSYNFKSAFLT
ncbi:hypothetical protein GGU11DRAFT_325280 [Lentinula aff. detonsa]|uniref:Uncharacterized protein n=1 Tax=Lentinula aff. detonsa TaxID=2804958 RepID=A0AA38NQG1_9AGAR|nr:hypothetical protein GGU10DRAFT_72342 [Lentinula aff. detonsa]KAJ3800900.1 hypothetical protein GGU11DRAFT_325280 [Lentinula aff. detonsa]